jgi:putative FmdB family regulatory protein
MPTYSFRCNKCKHEFDVLQRISDPYPDKCPKCLAENLLEKIFTGVPGLDFKGKWFKTGGY